MTWLDLVLRVCEHEVAPVVELDDEVVLDGRRAEGEDEHAVGADLSHALEPLGAQMLAQLHRHAARRRAALARVAGQVHAHARLDQQQRLLARTRQLDHVRLGRDCLHTIEETRSGRRLWDKVWHTKRLEMRGATRRDRQAVILRAPCNCAFPDACVPRWIHKRRNARMHAYNST
eukprot:6209478-Pleurochrysis_carterae.AAC.1